MTDARNVEDAYGAKRSSRHAERAIAELAARQHGVVSAPQVRAAGISARGVGRRLEAGRLHTVHRGVYAVGYPRISLRGRWMAAVLACGPGALLSHRSAAALWGLDRRSPSIVDLSGPRHLRQRPGIRIHRATDLTAADRTTVDVIPCLSVARTLLTLIATTPRAADELVATAERRNLLDHDAFRELLTRMTHRPGAPTLRAALADHAPEAAWTRSELERRFLALCRAAKLPKPRVNAWIALAGDGAEVDFSWPELRLAVEADSRAFHGDRIAFERDRRRDQLLVADGWRVVRFTWRQIEREPDQAVATLRRLVSASRLEASARR